MADQRLSNVIGAPFPEHVLTQLTIRAARNSTGKGIVSTRSNEEILFLANKSAWVKLTSSVTITPPPGVQSLQKFYENLGIPGGYPSPDDLRKNWILEAGTSISDGGAGINLRKGIGPNGAYGLGGTEELGYRPMPGLTSVTVDTVGTLGSLRQANINFKVWNMNQLNTIEALYFRLGYSMLLEWGHTQFFTNVRQGTNLGGTFEANTYGIDPFTNPRKEVIQQDIARRSFKLSGNYDGMLGIVTNFNWSFNQEGGYDCSIKLVGLGSVIESLRINLSYKMPSILFNRFQKEQKRIIDYQALLKKEREKNALLKQQQEQATATRVTREQQGLPPVPIPPAKNPSEIYTVVAAADYGSINRIPENQTTWLEQHAIYPHFIAALESDNKPVLNSTPDYYYKADQGTGPKQVEMNSVSSGSAGLYLNKNLRRNQWQLIPAGVSLSTPQRASLDFGKLNGEVTNYIINGNNPVGSLRPDLQGISTNYDNARDNVKFQGIISRDKGLAYDTSTRFFRIFDNFIKYTILQNSTQDTNIVKVNRSITLRYDYTAEVPEATSTRTNPLSAQKVFYFDLQYVIPAGTQDTVREVLVALETWAKSGAVISVRNMREFTQTDINIIGLNAKTNTFRDIEVTAKLDTPGLRGEVLINFNNTAFIKEVLPNVVPTTTAQNQTGVAASGDAGGSINTATVEQTDPSDKFASSLHAMLTAVKSFMQDKAVKGGGTRGLLKESITEITKIMYQDGILKDVFNSGSLTIDPNSQTFDVTAYARKGFNSNLMLDPKQVVNLPDTIDFNAKDGICTAYAIKYTQAESDMSINYPIYIKLGYLMAFLNNMCLIYDSTQNEDKHPYVYLDFNPYTNFCLTLPQHLSVDPFTCMIPFQGDEQDYLNIYPEPLQQGIEDPLKRSNNAVSGFVPQFKDPDNRYQGRTMEILLNVDYLLSVVNQYTSTDSTHAVYLKGFLDTIVQGINKSTGALNMFRVSYRDDSNTVIIKDDQFVPPAPNEDYMAVRAQYLQAGPNGQPKYGQLPVFGAQSLVREMEFRTDLSTKMASMIAISAQAETGSQNSKDQTPFSYLNPNYVDAYKPKITDATQGDENTNSNQSGNTTKKAKEGNNDLDQANQFNKHILNVYNGANGKPIAKDKIDFATNYYIERISKVKAKDKITQSAPFIPANLSLTIDGIAGIVMGNAFTIPEDRLPASLKEDDGQTKVGFVVVGLTHILENNQWLTKIRGQMIRLRDYADYGAAQQIAEVQGSFASFDSEATISIGTTTPVTTGPLASRSLYKDPAFRAKLKGIADSFGINDEDLIRIMYKESGLEPNIKLYQLGNRQKIVRPGETPPAGFYLFGGGLVGFTKAVVATTGADSLEAIVNADPLTQLDYYARLLKANERQIRNANIYILYMANFLPKFVPDLRAGKYDTVLQFGKVSAETVSLQNSGIARAAKKPKGTPVTIGDFVKYVDTIFSI